MRLDATNDLQKVKDAINQAYTEAVVETDANVNFATMTVTPGSASYTFPGTPSRILSLYATPVAGTSTRALRRVTLDQIIARRAGNSAAPVSNAANYMYCLLGINDFELYPTPQTADIITVWYSQTPSPLSADSDTPILPEPYATNCLKYGGLFRAAEFSGDPDGPYYQQSYAQSVSELRAHLNRKAGRLTGQFQLQDDYLWPPHDPSVDRGF